MTKSLQTTLLKCEHLWWGVLQGLAWSIRREQLTEQGEQGSAKRQAGHRRKGGPSHCSVACAVIITNSWGGWARPGAGPSDPPTSLAALLAQPRALSKNEWLRVPRTHFHPVC